MRRLTGITSFFTFLTFILYTTLYNNRVYSSDLTPSVWDSLAGQSLTVPFPVATCQRRPLASLSYSSQPRTYHEFDNILLIVFFSHARYDSIDDYKKVRQTRGSVVEHCS